MVKHVSPSVDISDPVLTLWLVVVDTAHSFGSFCERFSGFIDWSCIYLFIYLFIYYLPSWSVLFFQLCCSYPFSYPSSSNKPEDEKIVSC